MPISPAGVTESELRELCEKTIARLDIAGAQIAVAIGETMVQAEAGVANAERDTPVTAETTFQIGSTTKVYTAVLMMQLADEGLVDLDRPVTDYLPDVRLATGEAWRTITPRLLMAMTSGLDNGPYTDTGRGDDAVAKYVALLERIPLVFAPGTAYGYSNASTNVSGLIVETLTGQCWDDVLRERILGPAGLTESVSLFEELPYHRPAVGRLPGSDTVVRPWCFSRGMAPSGSSLATTARDLARFGQLFLRRGRAADGTRILSEAAVATMQTPQADVPSRVFADSWCVGPYRKVWGGVEVFGHSGTTHNGSSTLLWIPEHDVAVAVVVNTPPRGYPFADAVFDAVLRDGLGLPKPQRPEPDAGLTFDPDDYVGRYDAWGVRYDVARQGGGLALTVRRMRDNDPATGEAEEPIHTLLHPIAPQRFLPADDAVTGNHTWDIAFTAGADGRIALLHNGAFAARRGD
ncbi:serine hydrolase [Jiangella anatolica]|nr:serine hydrolase [Jiangella anatolica]